MSFLFFFSLAVISLHAFAGEMPAPHDGYVSRGLWSHSRLVLCLRSMMHGFAFIWFGNWSPKNWWMWIYRCDEIWCVNMWMCARFIVFLYAGMRMIAHEHNAFEKKIIHRLLRFNVKEEIKINKNKMYGDINLLKLYFK